MPIVMRRTVCAFAATAAICLGLTLAAPRGLADTAAGSAAFEKGDYVRAMAEWTNAAERSDADAEFGLGMLYERGDGELKQDYKQANRWYEKAAAHDHIGAQYRLALIWAAGGDDFPADPVEAYKWILLASEKGLAVNVKKQLEQVLGRNQQEEAKQRSAAWKDAQTARKAKEAAAVAAPAMAAPATATPHAAAATGGSPVAAAAGKPGGCPGWPFPTLPCTEQFPALSGGPAPARPPAAR